MYNLVQANDVSSGKKEISRKKNIDHIRSYFFEKLAITSKIIHSTYSMWKTTHKNTITSQFAHVTRAKLPHLCSNAVLLHQRFLWPIKKKFHKIIYRRYLGMIKFAKMINLPWWSGIAMDHPYSKKRIDHVPNTRATDYGDSLRRASYLTAVTWQCQFVPSNINIGGQALYAIANHGIYSPT